MKTFRYTALGLALLTGQTVAATDLAPLVISANRFTTTIDTAPVNITSITAEQIANSTATNLSQVLELQAGVYIKDLYGITGTKSSADMGGFGATGAHNTLILINGRRQNDVDLSGANLATIPLQSIARIEIVHGSSAVLYGDNAVSGVINIVTKNGFEQDRAAVSVTGGSFGSRGLNADISKNYGDTAVYAAVDSLRSDGYRDESQFKHNGLVAEISHNRADWNYGMRLNHFDEDIQLPGELSETVFRNDPTAASSSNESAEQQRNVIDLFIATQQFAAELSQNNKHQESVIFGQAKADLKTLSFTPRIKRNLADHQLIAGIDYYNSKLDTSADFGAPNINDNNTTRKSYALYVNDTLTLNPDSSINVGLRHQQVTLAMDNTNISTGKTADQRDDAVNAWEIGLNHRFSDTVQAHARIAESFRFPVLDEMWSYFYGTITPLKPQTGRHLEAGSDIRLSDNADISVNLFHITLEDEIGFNINTYSNENLDPTRHDGADINYNNQINDLWQIRFGYAWRDATFRSGPYKDKQIPEVPVHRATLTNGFNIDAHNRITADIIFTGRRYFGDDYANVGKQMRAYSRFNLGYQYKHANWKAQLRIDNVTDRNDADTGYYRSFSTPPYTYYPLPGRAWYLTVGAEF